MGANQILNCFPCEAQRETGLGQRILAPSQILRACLSVIKNAQIYMLLPLQAKVGPHFYRTSGQAWKTTF